MKELTQVQSETLRDAYKKHATELLAIEEAQLKLTTLVLGIFGAGASFLAAVKIAPGIPARLGLSLVVFGLYLSYCITTWHRNGARESVREALLLCERALGFFEPGIYAADSLYPAKWGNYAKQGRWLGSVLLACVAAIGFVVVIWC